VGERRSSPGNVGVKRYFDRMKLPRPNVTSGPLVGYVKKGRTYRSALAATGVLHIGDWVWDDLPDLLWPVLALSELGTAEAVRFVRWQKAVQEDLSGKAEPRLIAESLDGRLTSLDRLAAQVSEARAVVKARAEERGLLPKSVVNALASYPLRPAEWLVDREMTPPDQEEIDLLARAVVGVLKDGHREAVIKCLHIWSAVQAGTFSASAETIELLRRYPTDPRTRAQADSIVRAMWGARKGRLLYEKRELLRGRHQVGQGVLGRQLDDHALHATSRSRGGRARSEGRRRGDTKRRNIARRSGCAGRSTGARCPSSSASDRPARQLCGSARNVACSPLRP